MTIGRTEVPFGEGVQAQLENAFTAEYLDGRGYSTADLKDLPDEEGRRLMAEASRYASIQLCQVETRSHFVREMHGVVPLRPPRARR